MKWSLKCWVVLILELLTAFKSFCLASADDHHPACDNQEPSVCQLDSLFQMESKVEVHRKNKVKDTRWAHGSTPCWHLPQFSLFCRLCTGQETQPSPADTRSSSRLKSRRCHKQGGRPGINAWKRWTQWRQSQTNLYLVSGVCHFFFFFLPFLIFFLHVSQRKKQKQVQLSRWTVKIV